ncbi:MAG: hypothetical protein OXU20_27580 [Myxococcales bacterium]|nr:hypothetical protein [Myxococcales bacterium]
MHSSLFVRGLFVVASTLAAVQLLVAQGCVCRCETFSRDQGPGQANVAGHGGDGGDPSGGPSAESDDDLDAGPQLDAASAIDGGMGETDAAQADPQRSNQPGSGDGEDLADGVVHALGFDGSPDAGEWVVDARIAHGNRDGFSAQPPELTASQGASFSYACGDRNHTRLTFYYRGSEPAPGQELRFFVDDALYATYGSTVRNGSTRWTEVTILVSHGKHTYRWEATTDGPGRPPFHLDTLTCVDLPPSEHVDGEEVVVDFDDGVHPAEISGDWRINNTAAHSRSDTFALSAEAAPVEPMDSTVLELSCADQVHNQLVFHYLGDEPSPGQELRLMVDDTLYAVYGSTFRNGSTRWSQVVIVVPPDAHTYRWEATSDAAGRPPFRLDSFACLSFAPTEHVDGNALLVDFDDGAFPEEVGGNWLINNGRAHSGNDTFALSAQAPPLAAAETATLSFACDDRDHRRFSFYYLADQPAGDQELQLFVDDALQGSYGSTFRNGSARWDEIVVMSGAGKHSYRFEVETTAAGQPPFRLDSLTCQ